MARPDELPDGALVPGPEGVGVAGTSVVFDEPVWATGAAGGAGVEVTAGAGVAGAFAGVEVELDAAGRALGYMALLADCIELSETRIPFGSYTQ
jgi:hypothetical protein